MWPVASILVLCIIYFLFYNGRAYFRKIKHPGIRRFVKSALFEKKKFFFLISMKLIKKELPIREDSTSTCPSGLSKCPFVKQRCDLWDIWQICYKIENVNCDKKELNRNNYNTLRRSLLWNTCLQIKTLTNQNFYFSMSSIFWKRIY